MWNQPGPVANRVFQSTSPFRQPTDGVVLAAALPDLEGAGCTNAALAGVEARIDLTPRQFSQFSPNPHRRDGNSEAAALDQGP